MSKTSSKNSKLEIFKTPAIIQKVQTLVDKGNKVDLITPELSAEDMALLFSMRQMEGVFGFAEKSFPAEELDIPGIKMEDESRSPSQRLRSVIYVYWEKNTSQKIPFETYYRDYLEKLIKGIKEKLD